MRIYNNLNEAISETRRDLAEMGLLQKRYFQSQKAEVETREILGYGFKVELKDIRLENYANNKFANKKECWIEAERRFSGDIRKVFQCGYNPKIFKTLSVNYKGYDLLNYDYAARINNQFIIAMEKLIINPNSRQQIVSIWDNSDLIKTEHFRVPCSMYYHIIIQNNKLNLSYVMRSSDVMTHFPNDITIAAILMKMCQRYYNESGVPEVELGKLIFYTDNLHEYTERLEGMF